jgi:hypothetical protein
MNLLGSLRLAASYPQSMPRLSSLFSLGGLGLTLKNPVTLRLFVLFQKPRLLTCGQYGNINADDGRWTVSQHWHQRLLALPVDSMS